VDRAEEFIELFNGVENFLVHLVRPQKSMPFWQLVDSASGLSAAVHANSSDLKQFAKLRNAIVHDPKYPSHIVAIPSQEALLRFKEIVQQVLEPTPVIPTFATEVHCFSPGDTLARALRFMRENDFSQVIVRGSDGKLSMLTVEGITKWLADQVEGSQNIVTKVTLETVLLLEPPGSFITMGPDKTVFDAAQAFTNSIHSKATRLYAIAITENGGDDDRPIGFVTPWDLVHNPRLR
jgi:CBS domain-containing protein